MAWLRQLVAGLLTLRPGFNPRYVHMERVVDREALGQVLLRVLTFILSELFQLHSMIIHASITDAKSSQQQTVLLNNTSTLTHSRCSSACMHTGRVDVWLNSLRTSALRWENGQLYVPPALPRRNKASVPTEQEDVWALEAVWMFQRREKSVDSTWNQTPDRPAHSLVTTLTILLWRLRWQTSCSNFYKHQLLLVTHCSHPLVSALPGELLGKASNFFRGFSNALGTGNEISLATSPFPSHQL